VTDPGARPVEPAALDFVWEEGIRLVDIQLRMASDLDGKISPLIALVAGAIALVYSQLGTLPQLGPLLLVELMVVLVYLFFGFLSREFAFAPAFPALLEDANNDPAAVKARFLGNLREAYLLNLNSLSIKAFYVRCSSIAIFVVGVTIAWAAIGGAPR